MSTVTILPVWKRNSTAAEKLAEVMQYKESFPEKVQNLIVIYEDAEGKRQYQTDSEITFERALFLLEMIKHDMIYMEEHPDERSE